MEVQRCCWKPYFYPRPPRGGRLPSMLFWAQPLPFLSTPSARRATPDGLRYAQRPSYFYPRPPRGGRPGTVANYSKTKAISIHALREEGDTGRRKHAGRSAGFLSTPSARRATKHARRHETVMLFLSTPSARRATAKTETKSLFSNKLYNILHEFRRALIYNGSKNYPNHAK